MTYTEILDALREFASRERIEFLALPPDAKAVSDYAPIQKYALDLKNGAKPETAAEDLFTALCKDVLGFQPTLQIGSRPVADSIVATQNLPRAIISSAARIYSFEGSQELGAPFLTSESFLEKVKSIKPAGRKRFPSARRLVAFVDRDR